MHRILTKRIEIPWLAGIIVASSLVTGITYLLEGRGGFVFGTLCGEIAYFFGPLLCAFLWILLASNIFIVVQCVRLYIDMDIKAARRVMFSSYIYLPVVLLAMLADKIR